MATEWQSSAWIDVSENADGIVLRLGGEVDLASRPAVEPAIAAAIMSCAAVTLDLATLTFCDSQGLAMFVAARELAENRATIMEVRGATTKMRRLAEITGDDRVIAFLD